jgi:hypothetical protein
VNISARQQPHNLQKTADGSLVASNGKVLFFGIERFVKDICHGDCCFICGVSPKNHEFNNEHVLPHWLIKEYQLFNRTITLPNGTTFRYDRYTIPCCRECNSLMGKEIENPIRTLFSGGIDAVAKHLSSQGPKLLFTWLSLLFVKTHLKDRNLRMSLDHRETKGMIGENYEWQLLHHIHCVARSFYTGCRINSDVFGSLIICAAKIDDHYEHFDFLDVSNASSILLRLKDFAIIAVLDDACGAFTKFSEKFENVRGALSPIQLREVLAHLSYVNMHLVERPIFFTHLSDVLQICAKVPRFAYLDEYDRSHFGELLNHCCGSMLVNFTNENIEEIKVNVKKGCYTFLWDEHGNFDPYSMELL